MTSWSHRVERRQLMTTRDKYTDVPAPYSWEVPSAGDARFTWEYD